MPYDEELADRVRAVLSDQSGKIVEKKMFGGLSFMFQGNLCCGVIKDELMVRVGPDGHDNAIAQPAARIMDFTGRPMEGWIVVGRKGFSSAETLRDWVRRGTGFAASLPPK